MDFSQLNKKSAKSFNDQKALIKKLSQGRVVNCPSCQQPIALSLSQSTSNRAVAQCKQGCTFIELDLA
ncbi:hypothetical protein SIO17_13460 [Pseudoalteromonas piscicida]|uniref:Uncharacterized protein n=1 Tax=Pseudoalteromonas piscicida TaxID=43662 RepID=A0ABN5CLH5_PSEO7|nr:hypothetical protein [Pseudoalteromonas piscicida]ATD08052.1 hypothetical protein PPIS_a3225 [Pseudoalteromonas piscicida]WPU30123.1 hypothetical protein SIO17_13460 [Pseudoalteromonas piscicida]